MIRRTLDRLLSLLSRPEVRYLVLGGHVVSQHDGQRHYVDARTLARLHLLDPRECVLVDEGQHDRLQGIGTSSLEQITPRPDGNYPAFERVGFEGQGEGLLDPQGKPMRS